MNVPGKGVLGNLQDQMSSQGTTGNTQVDSTETNISRNDFITKFRAKTFQMSPLCKTVLQIRPSVTSYEKTLETQAAVSSHQCNILKLQKPKQSNNHPHPPSLDSSRANNEKTIIFNHFINFLENELRLRGTTLSY